MRTNFSLCFYARLRFRRPRILFDNQNTNILRCGHLTLDSFIEEVSLNVTCKPFNLLSVIFGGTFTDERVFKIKASLSLFFMLGTTP